MPASCRAFTICLNSCHLAARLAAGGVAVVRREKRQRIVAPIVRPLQLLSPRRFHGKLVHRHQLDAVTPSDFKYGIFSITPRYVPGCSTPLVASRVKPRTCIS